MDAQTPHTVTNIDVFIREIGLTRSSGLALDREGPRWAVVRGSTDPEGRQAIGALFVAGPGGMNRVHFAQMVIAAAASIARRVTTPRPWGRRRQSSN